MRLSRKMLGLAVAISMFATTFTPVLADENGVGDGTTNGDAATGNILAHSKDAVVVPTTLKIALNPKGYSVNKRYDPIASDATYDAAKVYYKLNDAGTAWVRDTSIVSGDTFNTAKAAYTLYLTTQSTDQIISLNYAISNKSTKDKVVKADFKISYQEKTGTDLVGTSPIIFVDDVKKTQAYAEGTNDDGAKKNELKMFLQVRTASSAGGVKVNETYTRATTYADNTTHYYKDKTGGGYEDAGTAGIIADADAFALEIADHKLYTLDTGAAVINPATTAKQLSDAVITPLTTAASAKTFVSGSSPTAANAANAGVVYALTPATYTRVTTADIDYSTTQTQLANDILECTAVPGVTGFTFAGSMNADCDWTKANTTAITLTPKYTIRDVKTGETTAVTDSQMQVTLAPSVTFTSAGLITISEATCTSSELVYAKATNGTDEFDLIGNSTTIADPSAGTITIQMEQAWLDTWAGENVTVSVKLKDNTVLTSEAVTFPSN